MTRLIDVCRVIVEKTPDAVAANVVDLESGLMLGGYFISDFPTSHFEGVSAAATNFYRGKETLRVEALIKAQRGDTSDKHFIEDMQFTTTNLLHFMKILPERDSILCLVTRRPGNVGMGWALLKAAIPKILPLVPK